MRIDLRKLKCSREELKSYIRVLSKLQPDAVWVRAVSHTLILYGERTEDGHGNPYRIEDTVTIQLPYLGKSFGFNQVRLKEILAHDLDDVTQLVLKDEPAKKFELPPSRKKEPRIELDADVLKEALLYLLPNSGCDQPGYEGIRFDGPELMTTNGYCLHFFQALDPITTQPAAMGERAGHALLQALRALEPDSVQALYHPGKKTYAIGEFLFDVEVDDVHIRVGSYPDIAPGDGILKERRPVLEGSVAFKVHHAFLESVCAYAKKYHPPGEAAVIDFETEESALKYTMPLDKKKTGQASTSDRIPMQRTMPSMENISFRIDADLLMKAIRKVGSAVQIISPWHPVDGLKYHYLNPLYVSGTVSGRFALVSLIRPKAEQMQAFMERKKAQVDAAQLAAQPA